MIKHSASLLFFVLFVVLTGCGSPVRGERKEIQDRISSNVESINLGYVRGKTDKVRIWYLGSDQNSHYFALYRPSKPRLPFSNDILFEYLPRNELTVKVEYPLFAEVGSGCDSDDVDVTQWKWPVNIEIPDNPFSDMFVLVR